MSKNKTRKIIYLEDFANHKKGETRIVDLDMAKNMIKLGAADIHDPKPKKPKLKTSLHLKNYYYFEKLKKNKDFLIEGFLYPKTITMLYSPPGQFKSLIAMRAAMSITNKKTFLKLKTKKYPVLLCDKENNEQILKSRLMGIRKGMNLRRKNFPLHLLVREGNLDDTFFVKELKKVVLHHQIRLVVFDTLHRFSDYEENKADDINRLYTEVFLPLVDECDCAVLFLHHTNKEGKYRGSGDFLGMVDVSYSLKRQKPNRFTIENEKSRFGELEKITGEIDFGEEYIKFLPIDPGIEKAEAIGKVSMLKEATEIIQKMFSVVGISVLRREIFDQFEMLEAQKNQPYSKSTIRRSLKWLEHNDYLSTDGKGKYTRIGT